MEAYEVRGDREEFVAEQVVTSQAEADRFISLYAGRLIKTREVRPVETRRYEAVRRETRRGRGIPAWAIILMILVVLLVIAYATGWLQWAYDKINTKTGMIGSWGLGIWS
jgi:hypothetical protein